MRFILLFISIIILVLNSCTEDNTVEIYEGLIGEEEFSQILAEAQLAESQGSVLRALQPYYKDSLPNYYAGIFEKHNITSEEFYYSMEVYSKDPAKFEEINGKAIDILKSMELELTDVKIPTTAINAMTKQQLAQLLVKTPIAKMITKDSSYNIKPIKDTFFNYLDNAPKEITDLGFNIESIQFTFALNTNTEQGYYSLRQYISGILGD